VTEEERKNKKTVTEYRLKRKEEEVSDYIVWAKMLST